LNFLRDFHEIESLASHGETLGEDDERSVTWRCSRGRRLGNEGAGIVHRSPQATSTGRRLILTLDWLA
jgi:hypothetical protein